nr:caspase family protein [Streptomyces sp. CBMA156]
MLICNSVFPNDPASLPPLQGPRADGMALWAALQDPATGMFDPDEIHVLHERNAGEILTEAEEFFASGRPGETLLFYYSGHGLQIHRELHLCGRDTIGNRLASTAVSADALKKMMERSYAATIVVVLDCCYSGAFAKGTAPVDPQQLAGSGRYVLTASSSTETAADTEYRGRPSPFTAALVDALRSAAEDTDHDGYVDLDDLYRQLKRALPQGLPEPRRKFDGTGAVAVARRSATWPERTEKPNDRLPSVRVTGTTDLPTVPNGPAAGSASPAGSIAGLHLRRRGDYTLGDLFIWVVNIAIAVAQILLTTSSQEEGKDTNTDNLILTAAWATIAFSLVEAWLVRRLLCRARSRRAVMTGLGSGPLYWVVQIRSGTALLAGTYLPLHAHYLGPDVSSIMLLLLETPLIVALTGLLRRGDSLYLAGTAVAFIGLLAPRPFLGYGAATNFGVFAVLHLILIASMFGGWILRRSARALACLPALILLLAILCNLMWHEVNESMGTSAVIPMIAMFGALLTLLGCGLGSGVPLPNIWTARFPPFWFHRLLVRLYLFSPIRRGQLQGLSAGPGGPVR